MKRSKPSFTPTQLFTGIIYSNTISLSLILDLVSTTFNNRIMLCSLPQPFDHSSYYNDEIGPNLTRVFIGFEIPVQPELGFKYKLKAVELENRYKNNNKRIFNIDPGILSLHNVILYSTKNFSHRIACQDGVYAEVTCLFQQKQLIPLDWTYPDFRQQAHQRFFLHLRSMYHHYLRSNAYV